MGFVSRFVKATQVFPSTFLCPQWLEQEELCSSFRRLHRCILDFINFLVTGAAEIATLVNWKWVSTCLWPCCVYCVCVCYLNFMICLMRSMPFHRSAAALALQHKQVNVDLSPRCQTESKFSTFRILFVCEKHNTGFCIELVLLGCFFIKCCTVSAFLEPFKRVQAWGIHFITFSLQRKVSFCSCFYLSF